MGSLTIITNNKFFSLEEYTFKLMILQCSSCDNSNTNNNNDTRSYYKVFIKNSLTENVVYLKIKFIRHH